MLKFATEKGIKIKGDDNIAKSTGKHKSLRTGCLKCLNFHRLLDANLDKASTKTSFPNLDANGKKDEPY